MKLLLCFTLGLVTFTVTNAKNIKIQIDPDDILKLVNGMMGSETIKNFATQLAQRGFSKKMGYSNPYHPEDDLVNTFHDAVANEKTKYESQLRKQSTPKPDLDPLDLENDLFVDENEVVSEDVLTENEQEKLGPNKDVHELKTVNVTKPVITRKPLNVSRIPIPVRLLNNDRPGKVLSSFKPIIIIGHNNRTTVKPGKKAVEKFIPFTQDLTRKDLGQVYKDDRMNFKPVQKRFVLKSSNDRDNFPNLK